MRKITLTLLAAMAVLTASAQRSHVISNLPDDARTPAVAPRLAPVAKAGPQKAFTPLTLNTVWQQPEGEEVQCMHEETFLFPYRGYFLKQDYDKGAAKIVLQGDSVIWIPRVIHDLDTCGWLKLERAANSQTTYVAHTPQAIWTSASGKNTYFAARLKGSLDDLTSYKIQTTGGKYVGDVKFSFRDGVLKQMSQDGTEIIGLTDSTGNYVAYGGCKYYYRMITDPRVTAPDSLTKQRYRVSFYDGKKVQDQMTYMAFDGNDVYLSCPEYYGLTAKGRIEGDRCVFKGGQYLGPTSEGGRQIYFYPFKWTLKDGSFSFTALDSLALHYDAATGAISCDEGYGAYFHVGNLDDSEYYIQALPNMTLTPFVEKPAVPVAPTFYDPEHQFSNYQMVRDDFGYAMVSVVLDAHDKDGNFLDPNLMTYSMYIDDPEEPFVFDSIDYHDLGGEAEMTELPFNFYSASGIYTVTDITRVIYFFTEVTDSIGFQQIYYGGGERNASDIIWYNIHTQTVGINGVQTGDARHTAAAYYDLSGRRLSAPQRGLNIVRREDGTVTKVMR